MPSEHEVRKHAKRCPTCKRYVPSYLFASHTANHNGGREMGPPYYDRPCAAYGLASYRYAGRYGWIMIGATDDADALREAARSTDNVIVGKLQKWNAESGVYEAVSRG